MRTKKPKKKDNWNCDLCGQEKDTLYFLGRKQICEECRNRLRKEPNGHIG